MIEWPASLRATAVAWIAGVMAATAHADMPFHIPVYTGTPLMISAGVVTQQTLNRSISAAGRSGSRADPHAAGASTLVERRGRSDVPAQMAAALPAPERERARLAYQQMLDKHPELMRQLGVPAYDVAAALATFLAGVYIAYHDVDFPDRNFEPLYRQVRRILSAQPAFARASGAERREMYERLAILGTFLALTREGLKQRPDPAASERLRSAANDYSRHFLDADAERLRITEDGFALK
jgi:hypothetical protein